MTKPNRSLLVCVLSALALVGCGKLEVNQNRPTPNDQQGDAGQAADVSADGSIADVRDPRDTGATGDDGGGDDATSGEDAGMDVALTCADITCGENATCADGACSCDDGFFGDPDTGCAMENPCADVECPAGSSCVADGSCACDPFFADQGGACEPRQPALPANRTATEVCDIWTSTYDRSSPDFWMIEPTEQCDPGVLHPEEQRAALHRTSVYRLLVGLYPVSLAGDRVVAQQECSMMMDANNAINHEPPMNWACYTDGGAGAAGSSNLALGVRNPAGTVDLYIADPGTPSLGHRRWIFNPSMGVTAFGHKGSGGCMYSFGGGRSHDPEYVAYPAPGPFPRAAIGGKWSISGGGNYQADFAVTITNMSDMSDVPVSNITAPAFGFLPSTLSWDVNTSQLPVDTDYQVTIEDANGAMVQQYVTHLVNCP